MKKISIALIIMAVSINIYAQQPVDLQIERRNEAVVKIDNEYLEKIKYIDDFSIEKSKTKSSAEVYLNKKSYKYLLENNIPFVPITPPSMLQKAKMATNVYEAKSWNTYPTYDTYVTMMQEFANNFPNYCQLDTIGYSVKNRLILALKISDKVKETEANEPQVFLSSSMHGDELVGYVLMLRLADYLLQNKDKANIKELIDNAEVYINPLSNPDGAYQDDNSTVYGATRRNANGVDLNRNFPIVKSSFVSKQAKGKKEPEPENVAMIEYMKKHKFSLSANFHGGDEVLNYPWDSFGKLHTDDKWFKHICRTYADTAHAIDPNYMDDFDNGITNGYEWYQVYGGRQDYTTHFLQGREITVELSHSKLPNASTLPAYWNKNYKSLIAFAKQVIYGATGTVTDMQNKALQVDIKVVNHDKQPSVKSNKEGRFFRLLQEDNYDFEFTKKGYDTVEIKNINIQNFKQTNLDTIRLKPILLGEINLDKTNIILRTGISELITATVSPTYALDTSLIWSSSNSQVASVQGGVVKAITKGKTTITVQANDSSKLFATCQVQVIDSIELIKSIVLDKTQLTLKTGISELITATVSPTYANDTSLIWSSSNSKVASVQNGMVTSITTGKATITAQANDKGKQLATCQVTVLTGVKEAVNDNITIYPNPVKDILYINFDKHCALPVSVLLINAQGVQVKMYKNIKTNIIEIDTRSLNSGLYTIKISTPNSVSTKKILIIR